MMVVTTLPSHFAVELVGGRRANRDLRVVKRKLDNPGIYFGQFDYPPDAGAGILLGAGIGRLVVITPGAQAELERRFPGIADEYATKVNIVSSEDGPALSFTDKASYVRVDDVLLANALEHIVRIRHIRFALLIRKETDVKEYQEYINNLLSTPNGSELVAAQLIPGGIAEARLRASQFANIFLMNKLHETSLGTFIDQHREILLSALEAKSLISEPHLPWTVPSPDPTETAINPDLFIQRADGFWDVYDLKLALLNKKDLTTGKRNRRRFVATIEDGIAQLAHYRDFLSIPEHSAFAREKYKVEFRDPRYVLVVGNYENTDIGRVAEAMRRFPDLELIDYDSLLQLYLLHEKAYPEYLNKEGSSAQISSQ